MFFRTFFSAFNFGSSWYFGTESEGKRDGKAEIFCLAAGDSFAGWLRQHGRNPGKGRDGSADGGLLAEFHDRGPDGEFGPTPDG
ncbi:hypothetical protein SDC9_189203 [bioreactor metagenome]|uniref:Uncharacterized protein n=1 Tax=bioreactor metagenome TaxID=1076179 RepID=A0A645HTX8_9ZZZZ